MAKEKKPKSPEKGKEKEVSEADLDKTVLDVDIRKLNFDEDMEETVMVRVPPPEEDSDLHEADQFFQEEITGEHEVGEAEAAPTVPKEVELDRVTEKVTSKPSEEPKTKKEKAPPSPAVTGGAHVFSAGYIFFSLLIFLLLAAGLLEALRSGGALRVPAILASGFGALCLVGSLLKRWDSKKGFLWLMVAWFAYVTYSGFYFYTTQTLYFLNFPLSSLLGLFLVIGAGVVAWVLLRSQYVPFLWKVPGLLGFLMVLVATGLALVGGKSFEGDLWGPLFLSGMPLFLRPGVFALGFAFPLMAVSVLLYLPYGGKMGKGLFKGPALPLLILCVLGSLLGTKLLTRQGIEVPLLKNLTSEDFSGSTILDPTGSSIRLIVSNDKVATGLDDIFHLEVAANLSQTKGNAEESRLMVRNPEGRPYANGSLGHYMTLIRGEHKLKGGTVKLEPRRLGVSRYLVLLVDMPSLVKTEVKTSLVSAIHHLARQLDRGDRLYVYGAAGLKTLSKENISGWNKILDSTLTGEPVNPAEALTQSFKQIAREKGLKQIIYLGDSEKIPPAPKREEWAGQAKKGTVSLDFLALGGSGGADEGVYQAEFPAALGFELLSAAATVLGDYTLIFPKLPPVPKILLSRTLEGNISIEGGVVNFKIQAANPDDVQALQFKIDNDKPIDLDPANLKQSIELDKLKVKPGHHQFNIILITKAGDEISQSFEANYVTKRPLQFVKPLNQDTIGGVFNVMFSPARNPGVATSSIELLVDGVPSGSATAPPYLISLDTGTLSPGEHRFQAVQTFTDGTNEAVELTVQVNPTAPMVKILRPSNGEFLSNLAEIEAQVGGGLLEQIQKVDYYVDGEWIGESAQAPHRFLWSNHKYPAGKYFIQARAHLSNQATSTDAVQVELSQGEMVVQADPDQSPGGRLFPENVEILIDASVSMSEPLGQALKMDLAKYALSQLSQALPQNVQLVTRVFGGASPASEKNCQDSYRLKKGGVQLEQVAAKGTSPLTYALQQMGQDLKKTPGSRIGLLITDGWDRCGEDPIEVVQQLAKSQNKVRLHIIYFSDVSPTNQSLLKRLAEVTGGRTYEVTRPEDLIAAIRDAVQVNFTLYDYKDSPSVNQPLSDQPFHVRTGDYRLEIDTVPPIQKESVNLSAGARKTFTVKQGEGGYQLNEE